MRKSMHWALALVLTLVAAGPALAQGTTGTIEGRVLDQQGLALPGANVTVKNVATGFKRSTVSDSTGAFLFPGLPVASYEVSVELTGFASQSRTGVVNVQSTTSADFRLSVATMAEALTVTAESSLIDTKSSGVGEVVTGTQIENLPLNGRQFGNLAALVPGVSLGLHTDPTKSTQFAPQVGGGGGRNINYLIDGGDNNDDTVGGLVQNFPLDSIGEFSFETQRFRADVGRAQGGVISVVTKSGTNDIRGSAFGYFRDDALNSKTETETLNNAPKGGYRRWQYGASLGGPIVKDRTHFFASYEHVSQDSTQSVNTRGLYPEKDGVYELPYRENMFVAKVNHQVNSDNYLSVRYGYNDNDQPYGTTPNSPPESWGTSKNKFHSANLNFNSVLGGGKLNEFIFQFSYFHNHIGENSTLPTETYPNGVNVGQAVSTPQTTDQHKYQFRDDFTWTKGRHELKAGVSFIYEPKLNITFNSGAQPNYTHLADSRTSAISSITYNGLTPGVEGQEFAEIPNNQYGFFLQDTWRVNEKLSLNLGIRYDLVTGFANAQEGNILFGELQAAAAAGVFQRGGLPCPCPGFEDFGETPKEDTNNFAPRLGFTWDTKADGNFVVRGGVGRYYDFAYTNASILFPVYGAQVPFGQVYSNTNSAGVRNANGTLFQVGQPLPPNQLTNVTRPLPSQANTPLPKQPYTDQANLGFSKAFGAGYAVELDAVYANGQDFGIRPLMNVRINAGPRRFLNLLPRMGNSNFRVNIPEGVNHYKGITLALKKRWDGKLQVLASYTLSEASSSASRRATDEFGEYNLIDAFNPFQDAQEGPTRTDARHRVTASAVWTPGWDLTIAPVIRYRSEIPWNVITGVDNNRDGANFDLPPGVATVNSARYSDFSQVDLRVSKKFKLGSRSRIELIGEVFNMFNDKNPNNYVENMASSTFAQPTRYSGDFRQGEQRLAQLGLRLDF